MEFENHTLLSHNEDVAMIDTSSKKFETIKRHELFCSNSLIFKKDTSTKIVPQTDMQNDSVEEQLRRIS